MKTIAIIETSRGQSIELPDEFRIAGKSASIRREGDAVILEPIRPNAWPAGFFENIRIGDPAFDRPEQGTRVQGLRLEDWQS